jgi:hypothetical protein
MADLDGLPRDLALARAGLVAPQGARERVRARLAQGLAAQAAQGAGSAALPSGRLARALGGVTRARAWTVGLMAASFVAGYWLGGERQSSESAAPVVAGQLQPAAAPPPAAGDARAEPRAAALEASGQEEAAAAPDAGRRVSRGRSNSRAGKVGAELKVGAEANVPPRALLGEPPEADGLAHEVALLQRVERAIRAHQGELALALIEEHEQRYPASALREERAAARVLAACVAAPGSEAGAGARAAAQRYLGGHARSVYADRVRTLCQIESGDVEVRGTKKVPARDTDAVEGASP